MLVKVIASEFYEYSHYIRGYSEETIKRYRNCIRMYSKHCNVQSTEDISEESIRKFFFYGRTELNWCASTFITYHKSMVVFLRWCVHNKYLQENYAEDIEVPKLEKKLPPKLSRQDAMRLLEVVYNYPYKYRFLRYRNHAMFSVFLFAGLRKKELLNLKLMDVDLENYSIFVRQGKGSKDRIIPITPKLVESLEKYLQERKRLNKTCPEFFTSLNRNCAFTDTGMKRLVKKMREASGIPFSAHKLRHTFATLMLEGGCDIYSLSKMMGHSDIKTTTIYLAATAEHLRAQIGKHPLNEI